VETTPGQLLREARRRRGVSQKRLAIRAGTTQSAISRIERDQVSPSVETLRSLLHLLGEELQLGSAESNSGVDRSVIRENLKRTPAERVDFGAAFTDSLLEMRRANKVAA
jgi:transcriptional regulator with XRE-family HTH domain